MEVIRTKTIQVDFQQKINNPIPRFYRNDNNHLQIEILDNGVLADVSNITRMVINYQFENEEIISRMITDINNPIDIEIGNAEQKFEGYVFCSLQVYDFSDRLTTFPFRLVFRAPINDTQEYEDDDLTTLNELIGEVDSLKWQVITAINEMQYESGYATEQGDYAKAMGDYAKAQGDYALSQGDYALAQGTDAEAQAAYAKEQGDYALAQGTSAETQAASAQTQAAYALEQGTYAKEQGDYAKTQGNAAKVQAANAQTQGNYAKEQAENAQTQAAYALEQGTYAENQGDYAKTQGDYVKAQGVYAETQGNYAKNQGAYAAAQASAAKTQATNAQTQAEYAKSQGDYAKEVADTIVETEFAEVLAPITVDVVNDGNDFSVGVDSVGTKYDVIESSETTMELDGQTLVNLWARSQSDLYATNNTNSVFENGYVTVTPIESTYTHCGSRRAEMYKPSTLYTVIANVISNTIDGTLWLHDYDSASVFKDSKRITVGAGETGVFIETFTTSDDLSSCYIGLRSVTSNTCTSGSATFQCIILEGDYTNVPIEYFEGLKSSAETNSNKLKVKSVGKNLFDVDKFIEDTKNSSYTTASGTTYKVSDIGKNNDGNGFYIKTSSYQEKCTNLNVLNVKAPYTISFDFNITNYLSERVAVTIWGIKDGVKTSIYILSLLNIGSKQIEINDDYDSIGFAWSDDGTLIMKNIQLEEGSTPTQCEPYKENITTITLSEPLRSLPNGVHDEIFVHDDKVVVTRNCKQIVLNGSENWYNNESNETYLRIYTNLEEKSTSNSINLYCDSLIPDSNAGSNSNAFNICKFNYTGSSFMVSLDITKFANATAWKEYLQHNNVTVVYQLATPTYEWFELPSPRLYKDGHVFIESGAVPLTTTKHEVNTSLRSAVDTNTNELWDVKNDIIDTNERIDTLSSSLPTISFNDEGNLVVTINGTSKIFIPQE